MSGVEPGFPGLSVQNGADLVLQEPDVWLRARMSGPTIPDLVWGGNFRIGGGNGRFQGQNWRDFVDGKVGKDGGKLDPLETKQIHGSKSTKYHRTNKSQKNLGAILCGDFRI